MSTELTMLFLSAVLGLVQVGLQSFSFKAQAGNAYTIGPRDVAIAPSGLAGRFERALRNFLETFPIFAAAVLMLEITTSGNTWSEAGAQLYFWGRVAYVPAYASGLPWVRTFIWQIATVGIVLVMVPLAQRLLSAG